MKSALSKRVLALTVSSLYAFFRRVKAMIAKGNDVINLGLGEPEANTPWRIKLAGILAIIFNKTKYVPSNGSADLREKIARKYGVGMKEVVVSHSAKLMNAALLALTNLGDYVLIPSPYFPPFVQVVNGLECVPVLIETVANGFQLTAEMVSRAIKECLPNRPKVLIINSPNNPTGVEYDRDELEKIVQLARRESIMIISDECYLHFSPNPKFSIREIMPEAIVVHSASKMYAMTGWRLGWGIMPVWLAERVELVLDHFVGPPSAIAEKALMKALDTRGISIFREQRQMLRDWLEDKRFPYYYFNSAFYAFVDFSAVANRVGGEEKLAELFLKFGVAVTPGTAFGNYPGYLRIAYCVSKKKLKKALTRMDAALACVSIEA